MIVDKVVKQNTFLFSIMGEAAHATGGSLEQQGSVPFSVDLNMGNLEEPVIEAIGWATQ